MKEPVPTNERAFAVALANRVLDRPYGDPDDDLAVLSRQLLRRHEEIDALRTDNERLTNALQVIEAGSADPVAVATAVLEHPARKALYG